jgi:CRP-like cAMP-binding protein
MARKTASRASADGSGVPLPHIANVVPTMRRVAAAAALFRQGEPTFGLFRLVSGRLTLVRMTPAGTQVPMHSVRPGELFAEASIFSARYHCDAIATSACVVLVYPKAELLRRLKDDAVGLWTFVAELAHRVHELRTRLEMRQIRSAPERVIQSLTLRCGASGTWKMDGTLKQFAEEIGLTHEALYRTLAGLERDGRISRGDGEIRLVARLRSASKKS